MILRRLTNQRGNILLFTVVAVVPIMLIFAGLAIDMGYFGDVDAELQRAMDAAALAGAGKLGFNCDNFHPARLAAKQYASLNPYRAGTINLSLNETGPGPCNPQDVNGDIVLGDWKPDATSSSVPGSWCHPVRGCFEPTLNGNDVDAVRTRVSTDPSVLGHSAIPKLPTSFLKLIGLTGLNAGATAIAWAPPPSIPPLCPGPFALTWDGSFPGSDPNGNELCGKPATFISSSGNSGVGFNSAGWANLTSCGTPNDPTVRDGIDAALNNNCDLTGLRKKGDSIGTNGGMLQNAFSDLATNFPAKFNASADHVVTQTDQNGVSQTVYTGKGWAVVVPVVDPASSSECVTAWSPFKGTMLARLWDKVFSCAVSPAFAQGNVVRNHIIKGWTQFLITQVINGGDCTVDNPRDHTNNSSWPPPNGRGGGCSNGTGETNNALRGIYGFYKCELFDTPGDAGIVASRGKPRLVR